jgi:hypothetical protein
MRPGARISNIAVVLALALAAALLAVPTIAAACNGGDPGQDGPHGYVGSRHHHHHWFPATEVGKVASFGADTGKLAITLKNGETVTGLVTEDTLINCGEFGHHGSFGGHDFRLQRHWHHGDWGSEESECGTESLVAGAVVDGALMHLEEGGAVFDAIFLAPPAPPVTPTPTPES